MLDQPTTFDAANRWLKGRVGVLNNQSSRALALDPDFGASVKANAFFSAQVASARVLDGLRQVSDAFSTGRIGRAQAVADLQVFLKGQGYQPDDISSEESGPNRLDNLASTARLNLILTQNAEMARAVGDRQLSMDPDVMELYPYYRYRLSSANVRRESHARFAGLILHKNDPFWETHTPPWDYNCQCSLEDVTEAEAKRAGVSTAARRAEGSGDWAVRNSSGAEIDVPAPASGYVFDVATAFRTCEMSRIENIPMRRAVLDSMRDFAMANPDARIKCVPEAAPLASAPIDGDAKADAIQELLRDASSDSQASMSLGSLSQTVRDALGISGEAKVELSWRGVEHMRKNHSATLLDGERGAASAVMDCFHRPGVLTSLEMRGDRVYLAFWNPSTGAYGAAIKSGEGWDDWQLIQAFYPRGNTATNYRTMTGGKRKTAAG